MLFVSKIMIKEFKKLILKYHKELLNGYKFVRWKIVNQQNFKMVLQNNYAEQCIKYLKDSLPYVKDFNKDVAFMLVSDGILDFEYASGKSCNTSFRIGHIK